MSGSFRFRSDFVALALAIASSAVADVRVTDRVYVRQDGATDAVLAACSSDDPASSAGGNRQQNEPSVAIRPGETGFVVASANDACTVPSFADSWQGVYVSSNGGATWIDSLLPGYPGDTSAAGQSSPLFGADTSAGDPLLHWDTHGNLFVGGIAFNRTASTGAIQQANGNAFIATYVRDAKSALGIAYVRTVIRDVIPGSDPREKPDGFDVLQCRATPSSPDTCANAGGLNQNIFGAGLTLK